MTVVEHLTTSNIYEIDGVYYADITAHSKLSGALRIEPIALPNHIVKQLINYTETEQWCEIKTYTCPLCGTEMVPYHDNFVKCPMCKIVKEAK